jgi:hypothetical protein
MRSSKKVEHRIRKDKPLEAYDQSHRPSVCQVLTDATITTDLENMSVASFMCLTPCIVTQQTGERVTNKFTVIVYRFLKCIYLSHDMFRLFPIHHQGACYMYNARE